MKTMYLKRNTSGRSMIEMLGVLAIIGVLSAGGIAGYSMAMSSYKANSLMDKVQMMSTQARILYNGAYGTGTQKNNDGELYKLGYVTDFTNPFSSSNIEWTGATGVFTIKATEVPKDACVKYLTSSWGDASIFGNVVAGGTTSSPAIPATVSSALTGCSSDANTVTWTFK